MFRSKFSLLFRFPLFGNCFAIALCLLIIVGLQRPKLEAIVDREQKVTSEQAEREEELERTRLRLVKRMPAFGFDNLIANWEMLQFLQYFGDEPTRDLIGYSLVPDYFRIILDRDPRFLTAYIYLGTSGTIYAAQPEETDKIMERGIQQLTSQVPLYSYYALRNKGINEILFLGDLGTAQKTFGKAADWASTYNDPQSLAIARQSRNTADFLASSPSIVAIQITAWGMILTEVQDERTQKIAIENIDRLGGEIRKTSEGRFQVIFPSNLEK
ncbi:MAG: hypothetical protein J7647_25695 [Cyanobacteria bacterium SBLK]|nr:hypothetical protein [Cyanobacteria bacterium SBLK]